MFSVLREVLSFSCGLLYFCVLTTRCWWRAGEQCRCLPQHQQPQHPRCENVRSGIERDAVRGSVSRHYLAPASLGYTTKLRGVKLDEDWHPVEDLAGGSAWDGVPASSMSLYVLHICFSSRGSSCRNSSKGIEQKTTQLRASWMLKDLGVFRNSDCLNFFMLITRNGLSPQSARTL